MREFYLGQWVFFGRDAELALVVECIGEKHANLTVFARSGVTRPEQKVRSFKLDDADDRFFCTTLDEPTAVAPSAVAPSLPPAASMGVDPDLVKKPE